MRNSIWLLGAVVLSACGPAGILSGKVTVEGGSPAGVAVIVYGPQSAATVTGDDGAFSVGSLPDGKYVVRATVRGADVEEVSLPTTITQGKASPEPILAFRASTAKVTGKVVMADGSDAANLTVTAVGPETRGARTTTDGSFLFDGLKTGAYTISVEAKDTREGRVAVGVNASGPTDAGELRLSPIGRFGGSVSYAAMPAAGVTVTVPGTSVFSVTDAAGRFHFDAVPTGPQSVNVRVGTAPFFRSATAMVTVLRGANPDVTMSLTDDPPKTGTVTGVVTFHGPRSPRDITVSAPGSLVTTTPQINGTYSLTLPVGVWDVVASAPQHPPRVLGRVTVIEGRAEALPGAELSWWRPIWRSSTNITPPSPLTLGTGSADTVPWSLVSFSDGATPRLALVNITTYDFRVLAAGSTSGHRISKNGKYAAWFVAGTAFVYEIATATFSTFAALQSINQIDFSTDESALFIQRTGPTLTRVKLATPTSPTSTEIFPPSGNASDIQSTTVDRWFVQDSSNSVRLVTPATDVPAVFTSVSSFSATPTAWAITNCGASCELWVLSPTSNAPALHDTAVSPPPGALLNFTALGFDNRGDYLCFRNAGTSAFCVKTADASHVALTAVPTAFRLNDAGDRVIWTYDSGLNRVLREEAMPPLVATANLGSNLVGWSTGWISPTRAFAYENSGAPRVMHLVKTGVDASDPDVGAQGVVVRPPLIVWPQSSTSRWRAIIGDGAVHPIDVATTIPVAATGARPLGTGTVTKYAAVSFDTVSTWLIDDNVQAPKQSFAGAAGNFAYRSGASEFAQLTRVGGSAVFYVFNTGALLEFVDGSTFSGWVGQLNTLTPIGRGDDSRTIQIASFAP